MLAVYEQLEDRKLAIHGLLSKLLVLKQNNEGVTSEMRKAMTEVSVLLVELRLLNRTILRNEDKVKTETEAAKGPVDSITLRLHNYLYEKNHYSKAIEANEDYRSKYPDLELVSEEDFFQNAPASLTDDPVLRSDPRKLYLKRLEYELHQREELSKRKEELEAKKQTLDKGLAGRRKFLETLPEQLKTLRKAAQPLQQQLGLMPSKKVQSQLALGLPSPLHTIFSQLSAQRDSADAAIDVEVLGKVSDAEAMLRSATSEQTGTQLPAEEGPTDMEVTQVNVGNEDEEDNQRRHKRTKHVEKDGEAPSRHPLAVALTLYDPAMAAPVPISLGGPGGLRSPLMVLRFELGLQHQKVLVSVTGGSCSAKLPHPAASESLASAVELASPSLDSGGSLIVDTSAHPYQWAQELAGLGDGVEEGLKKEQNAPVGPAKSGKVLQLLLKQAKAVGKADSAGLQKAA